MATTYQVFEKAERVERLSAAIYRALAERFDADAAAHALFVRLEAEELQHASRVRLLAARYRHDPKLFDRAGAGAGADELDPLIAESEAVLARIRAGTWHDDLAEAKRALAALEERTVAAHAHLVARGAHPALREFFETLALQDRAHAELLAP